MVWNPLFQYAGVGVGGRDEKNSKFNKLCKALFPMLGEIADGGITTGGKKPSVSPQGFQAKKGSLSHIDMGVSLI